MKNLVLIHILFFIQILAFSQAPVIEWEKNYGGSFSDELFSIHLTDDGGYIAAGVAGSNDVDMVNNHGATDAWIVKVNGNGDTLWTNCLGGSQSDWAYSMDKTFDNGYIVAGHTSSNDGNVSGFHGYYDILIAKLDYNGNTMWTKCYGGTDMDQSRCIAQTADSGFVIGGRTTSNNGDITGHHGGEDFLIIKTDSLGGILWSRCYGGSADEQVISVCQTNDNGFIMAGMSESVNGDVSGNHGDKDVWVVRTDQFGDTLWTKSLGGSSSDWASSIIQTNDGGFIFTGRTVSIDGDVVGNHGSADIWVVKLNSIGNIEWKRCYGGSGDEGGNSIQQIGDEGYIILGETNSVNGDVSGIHGGYDFFLIKTNINGDIIWTKTLGGSVSDYGISVKQTSDGYIAAGWSGSNDGDLSGNYGSHDCWIVKLSSPSTTKSRISEELVRIFPNPTTGKITVKADRITGIEVMDYTGKPIIIHSGKSWDITGLGEINLRSQAKGIYIIKVTTDSGVNVVKVVKE